MKQFPLISVIVPVYNTGRYLKKCVDSLVHQTYDRIEILLVDDGSEKETADLCDVLAGADGRIRTIHKENGGLISAWKCGTSHSTGEYLMFVDSDDWVDLEMISEMAALLQGGCREIISSDYLIERDNGTRTPVYQKLEPGVYEGGRLKTQVMPNLLGHENRFVTMSRCMKLISRELIESNMSYSDERIRMGEDVTVILPSLIDCERLVIMDHKTYYHYLLVTESMAHQYDRSLYEHICLLRENIRQTLHDKFADRPELLQSMLCGADREHILLLLLVLKNEARGNPKGYRENIRAVCLAPDVRKLIKDTPVEIRERANRLVYHCMKHPDRVSLLVLRMAMKLYYRS